MIKFIRDRKILDADDQVRVHFKAGEVFHDMSADEEHAHVRRGFAVHVRDGKHFDHEGNEVNSPKPKAAKAKRSSGLRRATGARPRVGRSRKPATASADKKAKAANAPAKKSGK